MRLPVKDWSRLRPTRRLFRGAFRSWARLLPARDREFILGDLDEMYRKWSDERGRLMAVRRYLGASMASVAAQRGARRAFGGKRPDRGGFSRVRVSGLWADIRQASRLFRRRPGFVALVAGTLGLGVGSAGVVFSMANELLLRPPPGVADQRDAAVLTFRTNERDYVGISGPDMEALRDAATLLDGFASTDTLPSSAYVSTGESRPVALNAYTVYGDYFELLGVRPSAGRLLSADETGPGAEPLVAVISERLWDALFARSPEVLGWSIQMAGQRLTVIGVAGGGFRGAFPATWPVDVWTPRSARVPLEGDPRERLWSRDRTLDQDFLVRLRPGVTLAAVEEQLNGIIGRLADADPEHREFLSELRAYLSPGLHMPRTRERILATLRAFAGAAALVVLIACANVANLLLVRALQSRGEVAVRRALGATGGQVARCCLVESALLAAAGTAVGLLVAWAVGFAFHDVRALPGFSGFALDLRIAGFAVAAIAATTLLFGVLPAVLSGRFDLDATLRGAGRGATRRDSFVRHAMSATQIALSLTLLIGGVLLMRTVRNLYATPTGIGVDDVSVVEIDLGVNRLDDAGRAVLYRRLAQEVDAVPGVERAAVDGWYGPYRGRPWIRIATPSAPADAVQQVDLRRVGPGWFEVLGVEPLLGRTFRDSDARASTPPVVLLTARLAQRLFDRIDVVGQSVRVGMRATSLETAEIIGVVGDVRLADIRSEPDEAVFLPLVSELMGPLALVARTSPTGPPPHDAIREAVEAVIPSIAVPQPVALSDRIDAQLAEQLVFMRLLGLLSVLAVVLAAVGLYAVIAFAVAGRRREFGIRMALGADGRRVAGLVAGTAFRVVASGTTLGIAGAYVLSGLIESQLFGVEVVDLPSYVGAVALLATIAAAACWGPALAAARVDPAGALRRE